MDPKVSNLLVLHLIEMGNRFGGEGCCSPLERTKLGLDTACDIAVVHLNESELLKVCEEDLMKSRVCYQSMNEIRHFSAVDGCCTVCFL